MSGFLKRKTTDTVNPAGGVNPASTPNVGQYGWTSYDAANVNQLIQYVNMAKEAAQTAKDSAEYVQEKYVEIQKVIDYLEDVWESVGPVLGDITGMYNNVVRLHGEVVTMHTDTRSWMLQAQQAATDSHNSAMESYGEAVKSETSAEASAASAAASEVSNVGSKNWYDMSKAIYDDLKEGQVYRGVWDPTTNAWPNPEGTNSVWDVSLPAGTSTHSFGGFTWRSGDRLLYIVAGTEWQQLAVGGGVDSVNGMTGAVTLTANDVGALPTTGGNLTGLLYVPNALVVEGGPARWVTLEHDIADMGYISHKDSSGNAYRTIEFNGDRSVNVVGNLSEAGQRVYSPNNKPTTAEIGAVGTSGAQTMTGQLNGVKYTATDSYAYVSRRVDTMGMFLGATETDNRTIIGGGPGTTQQGVLIRPSGITTPAGETLFNPDGTITVKVEATHSNHLSTRGYVDTVVKAVNDRVDAIGPDAINAMPKTGGDFTGPFGVKAATKSAMKVEDGASVRYNDGVGSWFHTFAQGNTFKWGGGELGATPLMQLASNGELAIEGPAYARTGVISQSRVGTTMISIETPEDGAPYIGSRTPAETGPVISMRFGQTEISVESGKRMSSGQFRVAQDGGLKFAPTNDISGTTWAMGINDSTRTLGINQYSNGTYQTTPFKIETTGITHLTGLNVSGGTNITQYTSISGGSNNVLEFHQPGNSACMVYKPVNTSDLRISQSNGAGGEALMFANINYNNAQFSGNVTSNSSSGRAWGDIGRSVFYGNGSTVSAGMLSGLVSQWVTFHGMAAYEHGYGFLTDGSGNIGNYGHTLWTNDGSSYHKHWTFRNNGGQESPSNFRIDPDGRMSGNAYEGYEDHFQWATTSLGTVSDARLKTVLGNTTKSALDIVNQFQFKRFVWNEKAGLVYNERSKKVTEIGLIAQEVEAIDPTLIKTIKVSGETPHDTKTLDTAGMLALALKAIQEQQAEINELKEKLNEFILK